MVWIRLQVHLFQVSTTRICVGFFLCNLPVWMDTLFLI